jgi:hypothetical protein
VGPKARYLCRPSFNKSWKSVTIFFYEPFGLRPPLYFDMRWYAGKSGCAGGVESVSSRPKNVCIAAEVHSYPKEVSLIIDTRVLTHSPFDSSFHPRVRRLAWSCLYESTALAFEDFPEGQVFQNSARELCIRLVWSSRHHCHCHSC